MKKNKNDGVLIHYYRETDNNFCKKKLLKNINKIYQIIGKKKIY